MLDSKAIIDAINSGVEKLIEFKKYKKSTFVFWRDGKIIEVSPEEMEIHFENLKKNKTGFDQ